MPTLPDWAVQVLQVLTALVAAPLISGVIARAEAIVQQRRGPRVLQPYYDIAKLLRKDAGLLRRRGAAPPAHHHGGHAGRLLLKGAAEKLVAQSTVPVLILGDHER